ncbi:EAL domain-containing protein [Chelatococcus sambhunathii]|uniref:EAL domain-containing protein n=1 Tax=Chelatococcus sambhunathii TaxID=363953 RepID=A0ABU1DG79_9HYPH|nr:EAL domain-containing protein [Chelatococcus sambhunathii]MDR4307009.1 EAL domain-containing protein [Chelatococcus sambhunathii]
MHDARKTWKRALLTALGVVAAPIVGLNALLAINALTTAQREMDDIARSALSAAEQRIDAAMTQLILLGLGGVRDCKAGGLAAMQRAEHAARFVSEISATGQDGRPTCTGFGTTRVVRAVSPEHGAASPEATLSVVAVGSESHERMLRLQWSYADGTGLRFLIPGDDFLPLFLRSRMTSGFTAEAELMHGGVFSRSVASGEPVGTQDAAPALAVSAAASSRRYPLRIVISAPGSAVLKANAMPFVYANIGGTAFAIFAIAIAVVVGRRSGGPIREIADGVRRGEFVPYYQPVIDIATGRIHGCEVLVRWIKRDGKVVPPGRFIGLAEASGEIFPMTLALLERARDEMAPLYGARPGLKLSFNLCAGHFEDPSIVDDVQRIFESSSIRTSQLIFEVTERQQLPDIPKARLIIAKLQALGARVALDDVGTGHGGLSYLLKLGVDVMKMDKMFVDAIGTDRYSVAIVDSLVKLAEDMHLDLVAEGVETIEQVEYLRAKGVRMAQGYVFSPPLPAASFTLLVEAMTPLSRSERRPGRPAAAGEETSTPPQQAASA